jgi:hypothetical protein
MAGFQTTVRFDQGFGVPGELKYTGPVRAKPGFINSASAAYNIVGATAFTIPAAGGAVVAGGITQFYGILANPKLYASIGTTGGGPLAPTLTLPNNTEAEFVDMGEVVISVPAACQIGDLLAYNTTTGAISTQAPTSSFTGIIAVTTGILTVSAIVAGGNIGIGSVLKDTTGAIVAKIIALGSGTGGNGTYQTDIITAVGSEAMTANSQPVTGALFVPNAHIVGFPQTVAGLALARLTN